MLQIRLFPSGKPAAKRTSTPVGKCLSEITHQCPKSKSAQSKTGPGEVKSAAQKPTAPSISVQAWNCNSLLTCPLVCPVSLVLLHHTQCGHLHLPQTEASRYPSLNTKFPTALKCLQGSLKLSLSLCHPINSMFSLIALPGPNVLLLSKQVLPSCRQNSKLAPQIPTCWCTSPT